MIVFLRYSLFTKVQFIQMLFRYDRVNVINYYRFHAKSLISRIQRDVLYFFDEYFSLIIDIIN